MKIAGHPGSTAQTPGAYSSPFLSLARREDESARADRKSDHRTSAAGRRPTSPGVPAPRMGDARRQHGFRAVPHPDGRNVSPSPPAPGAQNDRAACLQRCPLEPPEQEKPQAPLHDRRAATPALVWTTSVVSQPDLLAPVPPQSIIPGRPVPGVSADTPCVLRIPPSWWSLAADPSSYEGAPLSDAFNTDPGRCQAKNPKKIQRIIGRMSRWLLFRDSESISSAWQRQAQLGDGLLFHAQEPSPRPRSAIGSRTCRPGVCVQ